MTATHHADVAMAYIGTGATAGDAKLLTILNERAVNDYRLGFYYSSSVLQ